MEYIPGGPVAKYLQECGKFEDQITRSYTGQILDGLAYLHTNGVILRVSRMCSWQTSQHDLHTVLERRISRRITFSLKQPEFARFQILAWPYVQTTSL